MTVKKKSVRRRKLPDGRSNPKRKKRPFDARRVLLMGQTRVLTGLANLVQGVAQVGGMLLLAMITPEDEIEAAGGDLIEAMNGHKCGPECWHAVGKTPAERQVWWDEKMRLYREARAARAVIRKDDDWMKRYVGVDADIFEKPPTGGPL